MTNWTLLISLTMGIVLGVLSILIDWLLFAGTSPYRDYFLWNVELPNLWRLLNLPALMAILFTQGGGIIFIFFQWFLIGSIGYIVLRWLFGPSQKANAKDGERIPPSQRLR